MTNFLHLLHHHHNTICLIYTLLHYILQGEYYYIFYTWCLYFYCVVNLFDNMFFISLVKNALNPHYLVNCMYWLNTLALDCEDCEFVERFDLTLAVYLVRQKLWTLWITVCARVTLKFFKANIELIKFLYRTATSRHNCWFNLPEIIRWYVIFEDSCCYTEDAL